MRGKGAWDAWGERVLSIEWWSFSGGPPVPLIRDGSCVLWGATRSRSLLISSRSPGVDVPLVKVNSDSCLLRLVSARGIESSSLPISSARSVIARLDEPRRS